MSGSPSLIAAVAKGRDEKNRVQGMLYCLREWGLCLPCIVGGMDGAGQRIEGEKEEHM
jgi:hypothetical protein